MLTENPQPNKGSALSDLCDLSDLRGDLSDLRGDLSGDLSDLRGDLIDLTTLKYL